MSEQVDYVEALKERVQLMVCAGLKDFHISPNEETWPSLTPQERAKAILDLLDAKDAGKCQKIVGECMECRKLITEGEGHLCPVLRPDKPEIAELRKQLRDQF